MESLRGRVLVSSAGLYDPNFRHTVVLIGAHDPDGALGVVLNRPTELTIAEALPPLAVLAGSDAPLYHGGPVQPDQPVLLAELTDVTRADLHVFDDVGFLTGEVPEDIKTSIVRARVFVGFSGWGPGQLDEELEEDAWIVDAARTEDVFTTEPDSLWKRVLQRKGPKYKHIAMMPFDPRVN